MQGILCRVVQNRKLSGSKEKQHTTFVLQSKYISDKSKEMVSLKIKNLIQDSNVTCKKIFNHFTKTIGPLCLTNVSIEKLNNEIYHFRIIALH